MKKYPQILLDAWAYHEALRKLGFAAEDIFFVVSRLAQQPHTGLWVFVVLKTQGLEFSGHIAPIGSAVPEDLLTKWSEFAEELKTTPDAVLARIYTERFLSKGYASRLATALVEKGFTFPRNRN